MEITESILSDEIQQIFLNGPTNTNFTWNISLFNTEDNTADKYEPLKLIGLTIRRNYSVSYADEITCNILVPLGKYIYKIYNNRKTLHCTLSKKFIYESDDQENSNTDIIVQEFKVVLLNKDAAAIVGQGVETTDEEALDIVNLIDVSLQLIPLNIEKVRKIQIGGVYTNTKLDSLLSTLITNESTRLDLPPNSKLSGVDIMPLSNQDVKEHVVIPHGTLLIDTVDYLQKRIGLYNANVGSYIQDKFWYIFPLHDNTRFDLSKDTLTVIVLPRKKFHNIERTYIYKNGSRKILVTGKTAFKDSNGINFLNKGSGARQTNALDLIENNNVTKDNITTISRSKLSNEFIVDKNSAYAPTNDEKITSNVFTSLSNVNFRGGGEFKCVWQNCDFDFLRPGIQTRILYDDNGQIVEIYGVLIDAIYMSVSLDGITGTRYSNQAHLTFFVK